MYPPNICIGTYEYMLTVTDKYLQWINLINQIIFNVEFLMYGR